MSLEALVNRTLERSLDLKSKIVTRRIVNAVLDSLHEQLIEEGRVALPKFGIFEVKDKAARRGRHPITGESLEIPARRSVNFRPSTEMKRRLS